MNLDFKYLLQISIKAAYLASEEILKIYNNENFEVQNKKDGSPITLADKNANHVIEKVLFETNIPILSEEGKDIEYKKRKSWKCFWIVDPLDGTKEFIKRNGEFTVNIALIKNGIPVLGVIYVPVTNVLYFACQNIGSFKLILNNINNINIDNLIKTGNVLPIVKERQIYTVVSSRSHVTDETKDFFDIKRKKFGEIKIIPIGSSLKICLVAEGIADAYPRYGPTMEWDIAAGHAIANYAGKKILQCDSNLSSCYNKKSLVNPWFIVS